MGQSPKARLRKLLIELYELRGSFQANVWTFYSGKIDEELGFIGDLEYLHAIWMDAAPEVESFVIRPGKQIVKVGDDDHATEFDAIAKLRTGPKEAREVKPLAEETAPTDLRTIHQREAQVIAAREWNAVRRVVTDAELAEHVQLIQNWVRAAAWIRAAQSHPLEEFQEAAGLRLHNCVATIAELEAEWQRDDWPLFLPAVFRLVQRGLVGSDLDRRPLSRSTRFWAPIRT